ncbi:hypothetical protein BU16DRAFT_51573 [Lophium mytilinum]|uniref:Uncharacterized protein n=1 Tax=Lophium mytilinum TaxID=390894 RepID=A0A6A6QS57_9PEZI|nr:hypothetical protein BU16DRAFT_51573 [Lophium mytilinum]
MSPLSHHSKFSSKILKFRTMSWSSTKDRCEWDYFDLRTGGPTFKTIALSFLVVVLTVAIEATVHSNVNATSEKKTPQSAQAASDAPPSSNNSWWFNPKPSPNIRANRLTLATILFIPLCVAFGFRMAETAPPNIRWECREILDIGPTWGAIIPLTIVPFVIASVAWTRAFVDCLLIRWGKGLHYPNNVAGSGIGWPPVAPILLPLIYIWKFVKKATVWVMGSPDIAESVAGDIELGGEERVRLIDDFDEAEISEGEEPPAYDGSLRETEIGFKVSQ